MASSVSTINSLLGQFQTANDAVVSGLSSGANVATAEDTRDSLVTQLAQQIGVTTSTAANGSMSIYTDNGVTLFQDTARTVSFTPTSTYADGDSGLASYGRRRPDHGIKLADADPVGRARRLRRRCATRLRRSTKHSSTKSPAG